MPEARSAWKAFGVLAIAVFLAVLDLFIVNIAFPDIRRSFSSASLSWILSLASFVAIVGSSTLATKSDFDGTWLFMAIASAGAGIALTPLLRHRPHAAAVEAPAPILVIRD